MQLRHWLMTSISLGFLFGATGASWAQETAAEPAAPAAAAAAPALPQACVDAGAATEADCKALIAEQKAAAKAEADKAEAEAARSRVGLANDHMDNLRTIETHDTDMRRGAERHQADMNVGAEETFAQ